MKQRCIHHADDASGGTLFPTLEARSFQQVADIPVGIPKAPIKATVKGSVQGQTSRIPYRSSKPPIAGDVLSPDKQQAGKRSQVTVTEDGASSSSSRRYHWFRYPVIAAIIMYSLYASFTSWVLPTYTALSDQWHYGDARVSHTTMKINGVVRDLLGIGYKGRVEVIILPDPKHPQSQAQIYLDPQALSDTQNRFVVLHPMFINPMDPNEDIVVEIEGMNGIAPVLYGRSDGSFQWNTPV